MPIAEVRDVDGKAASLVQALCHMKSAEVKFGDLGDVDVVLMTSLNVRELMWRLAEEVMHARWDGTPVIYRAGQHGVELAVSVESSAVRGSQNKIEYQYHSF